MKINPRRVTTGGVFFYSGYILNLGLNQAVFGEGIRGSYEGLEGYQKPRERFDISINPIIKQRFSTV
jgi:hypothetical protein